MTPKVSVIMSTYCRNRGDNTCPNLLRRALDSILGQTFKDFELILIDDGSTDGSESVCREYAGRDSRIRYFRESKNSGCPAKRYNDGMVMAKADLFAHMFDDDEWTPRALFDLYRGVIFDHSGCGMVYGIIGYTDMRSGARAFVGEKWDLKILEREKSFCILGANSVIIRRAVINAVGGFDESPLFRRVCDWDLWVRIGRLFSVSQIPKFVGNQYQGHADSIGLTIPLSPEDWQQILAEQNKPDRRVRLQDELEERTILS